VTENELYYGSDEWIPHLNNLCFDVLKNFQKRNGGQFLSFRDKLIGTKENPGKIVEEYHASADSLKEGLFGDNAPNSHLDHHKISALYIRSFLIHQPFLLETPTEADKKKICLNTALANEYFSIAYLAAIFKGWNEKYDWVLAMEARYKFDFIKLLYSYKKDIKKLDPFALSNIICLIEKHYFRKKKCT